MQAFMTKRPFDEDAAHGPYGPMMNIVPWWDFSELTHLCAQMHAPLDVVALAR